MPRRVQLRTPAEVDDLKDRYRAGKVGDVEVKTKLATALNAHLEPIRERRAAVVGEAGPPARDLLRGVEARAIVAGQTMERVRRRDAELSSYE